MKSQAPTACSSTPNTTPDGSEYHTIRVQNPFSISPQAAPACRRADARANVHVNRLTSAPTTAATGSGHVPTNPSQLAPEMPISSKGTSDSLDDARRGLGLAAAQRRDAREILAEVPADEDVHDERGQHPQQELDAIAGFRTLEQR